MENEESDIDEDTRRLVVAITDFLREQLIVRTDLVPEDRDCLEIAIQCLEMAYGLEGRRYLQYRFSRPLMDIFNQVTNPVSIRDKLRAEAHKDEGNSYMRRKMFSNAEAEYTQAIELDRWNAIYYCNRASARIEQNNYFEAISDCRQALALNPDYAKAHAKMGQSYALVHRPREASRCFRQALEMDPTNEQYRNNLRVAESQIERPDAGAALLASLISSLFGMPPRNADDPFSTPVQLPTSFMIITESHPPVREDSPEGAESDQLDGSDGITGNASEVTSEASTESHNIVYPMPYGVVNEGAEERPTLLDVPTDLDQEEEELYFRGYDYSPREHPPTPHPSDAEEEGEDDISKQETDREMETEEGLAQPDASAKTEYSVDESTHGMEEQTHLNAKIKVSNEDAMRSESAAANEDSPSTSDEPPRIKVEYATDHTKDTNKNIDFLYKTDKPKKQSNDGKLSEIDHKNQNVLKPPVNEVELRPATGEGKGSQMDEAPESDNVSQNTDAARKLAKDEDDQQENQNLSVTENNRNADMEHDKQSNVEATENLADAEHRDFNKETEDNEE